MRGFGREGRRDAQSGETPRVGQSARNLHPRRRAGAPRQIRDGRRPRGYAARPIGSAVRFLAKQISLQAKRRAQPRQSRRIFSG